MKTITASLWGANAGIWVMATINWYPHQIDIASAAWVGVSAVFALHNLRRGA